MESHQVGPSYEARKALFARGIRNGRLTTQEIEEAVPSGTLTASERWLLYFSLRAAQIDIVESAEAEEAQRFQSDAREGTSAHNS
jgi:hypothetical protein